MLGGKHTGCGVIKWAKIGKIRYNNLGKKKKSKKFKQILFAGKKNIIFFSQVFFGVSECCYFFFIGAVC